MSRLLAEGLVRKLAGLGARALGPRVVDRLRYERFVFWLRRRAVTDWEPDLARLVALVPQGARVLDIGANYGLYTAHLARAVGADGRVLAVEPVPSLQVWLRRLIRRFGLDNVSLAGCAVTATPTEVELTVPVSSDGLHEYSRSHVSSNQRQGGSVPLLVQGRTLDELVDEFGGVDVIKCDVEGAELAVLEGGVEALSNHRPLLMLELSRIHGTRFGTSPEDIIRFLEPFGYRPFIHGGEGWEGFRLEHLDEVAMRNVFFLHRKPG